MEGMYIGECKDGYREGYGLLKNPNGNEYDGQWERGKRHGEGVFKDHWMQTISRVEYKQGSLVRVLEKILRSIKDEEDD